MSSRKGEEAVSSIPSEGDFLKAFTRMKMVVEKLYQYQNRSEPRVLSHANGKKEVGG